MTICGDENGGAQAATATLRISFTALPDEVRRVLGQVRHWLERRRISAANRGTIEIVLAEALNNVVEHAYAGSVPGSVGLALHIHDAAVLIAVHDRGRTLPAETPPVGAPRPDPATLPEGGFGWHLIDDLSQSICYAREAGCNRLCLRLALQDHDSEEEGAPQEPP